MQKTAQKRSILNKLREMTNVSGIAAEKFFNPEFKRVMESLRKNDDNIRSIIAGSVIGDGDREILKGDATSLKDLLKSAKSAMSRREYMSAAADLGRFHKKLFDVKEIIGKFDSDVEAVHHEFLFKDLSPEQKEHLQGLKTRFAFTASEYFIKEAGIMDFFMNIGTKRGRALAAWEKRYPRVVGKIKTETNTIYQKSVKLLGDIISSLKEMASARSIRNVDNYVKASGKLANDLNKYDIIFKSYYTSAVKPFLDKIDLVEKKIEDAPTAKAPESKEVGQQEIVAPELGIKPSEPAVPSVSAPVTSPEVPPLPESKVTEMGKPDAPTAPQAAQTLLPYVEPADSDRPTIPGKPIMPEVKKVEIKKTHKVFFESLQSLSNEEPILLSAHIKKYARSIQITDPETAIQLFQIAKNIV
jgi:hypothetical protein